MKILEVITAPMVGGAQSVAARLAQRWQEEGHHVDIAALDPAGNAPEFLGSPVAVAGQDLRLPMPKQLRRTLGLRDIVRSGQYDVIQSHCLLPNLYARIAGLGQRDFPPVVITLHSAGSDYGNSPRIRLVEQALKGKTGGVVAVSAELAEDYRQRFPAGPDPLVIPNGIPYSLRPRADYRDRPALFLSTSRIAPAKDIRTMLLGFDAFLGQTGSEARLMIAGPFEDRTYGDEIRALHRNLTHGDQIELLGARADIPGLLAAADAFVHSAYQEAHSLSILEAAGAGLPIISSDVPEVVATLGDRARYFTIGDVQGLACGLADLTMNWREATERARCLAPAITAAYSMEKSATQHLNTLRDSMQV